MAAELRCARANAHKKRKNIERLTDQEGLTGGVPGTQATKRQRRTTEVGLSGENRDDEADTRDAVIADLQAQLRDRDREISSLKEHEKLSKFLLDQSLRASSGPRTETEALLRIMASAESPQEIHDVSGQHYWKVLPHPIQTGRDQKVSNDMPKTACEMVLKLHALIAEKNFADALPLYSELTSGMRSSEFHQAAAASETLQRLTRNALDDVNTTKLIFIFNLRELGVLLRARFGLPPVQLSNYAQPRLRCFDIYTIFCQFVSEARTADPARVPGILAKISFRKPSRRSSPGFYHEETSKRGWLSNRWEGRFLLIDFNAHCAFIIDNSL
jgi:hypothetical protein